MSEARVLDVMNERTEESLNAFWSQSPPLNLRRSRKSPWTCGSIHRLDAQASDNCGREIVFDEFHILKHLGDAVDEVRRREHRELRAEDDHRLAKTRYLWLTHPERLEGEARARIESLRRGSLRTARAFSYKEHVSHLWGYVRRGRAVRVGVSGLTAHFDVRSSRSV